MDTGSQIVRKGRREGVSHDRIHEKCRSGSQTSIHLSRITTGLITHPGTGYDYICSKTRDFTAGI